MPASGCPGIQAINPICQAGSALSSAASAGASGIFGAMTQWVADGASWLVGQIGDVVSSTTSVDVGAGWFESHYRVMVTLLGVLALPLLLGSVVQSILRQDAGPLVRSTFVHLPLAMVLAGGAVKIVQLALTATDALSDTVSASSGTDLHTVLSGVGKALTDGLTAPAVPPFVVLIAALLVVLGALALWVELLLRAAAVYVAVLFLPLALASVVWPAISHWFRRLVETLAALILSKLVVVAILSLAAGALAGAGGGSTNNGSNTGGGGLQAVLAGSALLLLAAFSPYTLLRLVPMVESSAVGQLEGLRHRVQRMAISVPRNAASFALRQARLAAFDPGQPGTGLGSAMEAPGDDGMSGNGWSGDSLGAATDHEGGGGDGSDDEGGGTGSSFPPPDPWGRGARSASGAADDDDHGIPMWKGNRAATEVYEQSMAAARARREAADAARRANPELAVRRPTRLDGPGVHVIGRDPMGPVIQWIPPDIDDGSDDDGEDDDDGPDGFIGFPDA